MEAKFSQRVMDVLVFSKEEAHRLNSQYVGVEHIFLGILREGEGLAIQILKGLGIEVATFRKEIELSNTNFTVFIEASDLETESLLLETAKLITPNAYLANSETRCHLHLSGVFASNFVNYLYAAAYDCVPSGYNPDEVLLPLMEETLHRLKFGKPDEFQTGPALRKDEKTIDKHIEILSEKPELQDLYQSLSEIIKKRYS